MPVALIARPPTMGFAPVARPRFLIGSDLDCDLVDRSEGVASYHARIRLLRGEYVLMAMAGCSIWAGEERVPLLTLRDGDNIRFSPDGTTWQFRSRVEGSFWPPEYSVGEAWVQHPAFQDTTHVPEDVDWPAAETAAGAFLNGEGGRVRVLDLGPVKDGKEANAHLRFLAALGGAPQINLAPVIDGGVTPVDGEVRRWMAVHQERTSGSLIQLAARGSTPATNIIQILLDMARLLAHVHQRGIVLRNLHAEGIRLGSGGEPIWSDYAHAGSLEEPTLLTRATAASGLGSPGCPEDIYQLGRIAGLLFMDRSVTEATEIRLPIDESARTRALTPLLKTMQACLAEDPAARPEASDIVRLLEQLPADTTGTPARR